MFLIQLGHPKIEALPVQEFEKIQDIFLRLFRTHEESIYLYWNEIPIRFRYKEDLYWSFNDMLAMVWLLQKESKGKTKVTFKNQLLTAELILQWEDDDLNIEGSFEAFEDIYQPYAQALNEHGVLRLSKEQFLSEWKTFLHQVIVAIDASNCTIADGVERRRLELLLSVEKSIDTYGRLYIK